MSWTTTEIEEHIERQPRLGVALLQVLVAKCIDLEERLQSFTRDTISDRIARTLLGVAKRIGIREQDGSVRIPPMTHGLIADTVGSSRAVVTTHLLHLRKLGLIRYSRNRIIIYPEAIWERLRAVRN